MNEVILTGKAIPIRQQVFNQYSALIVNANDSLSTMNDMLESALAGYATMRNKGHDGVSISVVVDGGLNTKKIALREHRRFIQIAVACAKQSKAVKDLSEEEKFAICVACDVPIRSKSNPNALLMTLETAVSCAITLEDGRYVVYYAKE